MGQQGNAVDLKLAELIKELNIRMPVKLIEKDKYLVGTRVTYAKLDATLMVRVGGGYVEFADFVKCEEVEIRKIKAKVE